MSYYLVQLGMVTALAILFFLGRSYVVFKRYPSAPGPRLGALTHWWYVWKVSEGHFEAWNITQHKEHGVVDKNAIAGKSLLNIVPGKVIRVAPDTYSIDDPDAVKVIYGVSQPMPKGKWYEGWGDPTDPNMFSTRDGKIHSQMRRLLNGIYSMTAIRSYEPYVDNCVSVLFKQLDRLAAQGKTIDLQRWMQCYAFDVIGELTFGGQVGFLESGGKDIDGIIESLDKNTSFATILGLDFRLLPFLLFKYGNPLPGLMKWTQKLEDIHEKSKEKEDTSERVAEDFVSKLGKLREKDPENFDRNKGEQAKLANVGAGSDTTSVSLTGILFFLFKYPKTMAKLRTEILEAIARGEVDEPITFDQAQKLPYLQAVIKEGMRMHPATGLPMWRVVPKGGVTIAGTFFPENSTIGINTWVAHYNTEVFGLDADEFRPERWMVDEGASPENISQMDRYYLPFGAGTRTCIGKNISILEMSKLIPELIKRYDFELLSPDMKYKNHWFVKQYDLNVKLRRSLIPGA